MDFGEAVMAELASSGDLGRAGVSRTREGLWNLTREELLRREPDYSGTLPRGRICGSELKSIDFSGVVWKDLSLENVVIADCRFDRALLESWTMTEVQWSHVTFRRARFDVFAMGGQGSPRRSSRMSYEDCDFSGADMRDTFHTAENYIGCRFLGSRLAGVDFDGSAHHGSVFSGTLEDVVFRRKSRRDLLRLSKPNSMLDVDFSTARLVDCRFQGLTLSGAVMPSPEFHLIFQPKVATARRVLAELRRRGEQGSSEADWMTNLAIRMREVVQDGPVALHSFAILDKATIAEGIEDQRRAEELVRACATRMI